MISWLITECDADVNALDLDGRLPGDANLSLEAPNLQPTTLAIEIKEMLENARQGRFPPGTPKTDTSTIPSAGDEPNPELSSGPNSVTASNGVNVSALIAAYEERCRQASRST